MHFAGPSLRWRSLGQHISIHIVGREDESARNVDATPRKECRCGSKPTHACARLTALDLPCGPFVMSRLDTRQSA
jgi:hypothetical protein